MQLKLRVTKGSSAGKEIPITKTRFMIGRGDDCQLRPHSDVISRNHCCIVVEGGRVYLDDMGSKNGSYVNEERVEGRAELRNGDELRIGPLHFVVVLETSVGGAKREPVADIHDAASRTAGHSVRRRSRSPELRTWCSRPSRNSGVESAAS